MESCEIHSMSMEFLTAEHHEKFFGTDTPRYELAHAEDAMYFCHTGPWWTNSSTSCTPSRT